MPELAEIEYKALRQTIRERGSVRMCAVLIGLAAWAALALAISSYAPGAATMVPFVVLAGTFEINFFIHTGVERVGRYVQVFYEEANNVIGWETSAMNYGRKFPGGLDPLFVTLFAGAAVVNLFTSLARTAELPGWTVISVIAHLTFAWRVVKARRASAEQRAMDLDRFRSLRSSN
jgi:hypothetical protein